MFNYFIYNHGGSQNHGCEAIVRTILKLFGEQNILRIYSESPEQDQHYNLSDMVSIWPSQTPYSRFNLEFLKAYCSLRLKNNYIDLDVLPYRKIIKGISPEMIEISVGGDVYCYDDYLKYVKLHNLINKRGCRSILIGCSIEKSLFSVPEFIDDIRSYSYISARESLTYSLLMQAGCRNIDLIPDSAFLLEAEYLPLPEHFLENKTIGINISPLVMNKEKKKGVIFNSFLKLIRYIIDNTDFNIALIPHVIWEGNDDRTVLTDLFNCINRPDRIVMINDYDCMRLKGYISRCRMFIGARTHATIAAYSSCVPTLTLGYSIKSRGIATDLFGTAENYVIQAENIENENDMIDAFCWLLDNEDMIRNKLIEKIPGYCNKIECLPDNVTNVLLLGEIG